MLQYHLDGSMDVSSRNSAFINRSVDWIVSFFNVDNNTNIADFGCGPGLYTTRFSERGADVTGIDFSARSIQYAKDVAAEKGLHIHYVQKNYLQFETSNKFNLITMIMCDFCALSPEQRKSLLNRFYTLLKPGGAVLLDVYSLNSFNQREEVTTYGLNLLNGFWSPDTYYAFLNTFKYEKDNVILDKYTIIEKARTRVVYNWLQYFSLDSLRTEFEENGFTVDGLYSDVSGSAFDPESQEIAIVARKV